MRRVAAKLAFVHRTLWQRDQAYRWAVLLGPPPLLGCALAALALTVWQQFPHAAPEPGSDAPWAHWTRPLPSEAQPYTESMALVLPKTDPTGGFIGFQPGWFGDIRPMSVDATMDVNVIASAVASLTLDGPTIPLARIVDAGPTSGLFVGAARTLVVVRTPGLYAFSAQLAWSGTQTVNCVVRLASAHHRLIRNVNLNVASQSVLNYAPTEFRLKPGLLVLQTAVGCWRGDHAMAPGTLTLLVRRPGEVGLTPVAADEVIRPRQGEGLH
jgi:hypothetical protein